MNSQDDFDRGMRIITPIAIFGGVIAALIVAGAPLAVLPVALVIAATYAWIRVRASGKLSGWLDRRTADRRSTPDD